MRELPTGWFNHEGYRAIYLAALNAIIASPDFHGAIYQQSPRAAHEFALSVLAAALTTTESSA